MAERIRDARIAELLAAGWVSGRPPRLFAVQSSGCAQSRALDVTVRVGSPKLDNYHRVQGDRGAFTSAVPLPIENGVGAIRQRLWLETDRIYRAAADRLIKIRTSSQVQLDREDSAADFTDEQPATNSEPAAAKGKRGGTRSKERKV